MGTRKPPKLHPELGQTTFPYKLVAHSMYMKCLRCKDLLASASSLICFPCLFFEGGMDWVWALVGDPSGDRHLGIQVVCSHVWQCPALGVDDDQAHEARYMCQGANLIVFEAFHVSNAFRQSIPWLFRSISPHFHDLPCICVA